MFSKFGIIYLWDILSSAYCKKHKISWGDFCELNSKYGVLQFIADNKDVFNHMGTSDSVKEIDNHIKWSIGGAAQCK